MEAHSPPSSANGDRKREDGQRENMIDANMMMAMVKREVEEAEEEKEEDMNGSSNQELQPLSSPLINKLHQASDSTPKKQEEEEKGETVMMRINNYNHEKSVFTPNQLHELHQQTVIYRHFASAIPIPPHLLLPILKSVSSTFEANTHSRFYPRQFDYKKGSMDSESEPERCRRTDGKRWRCKGKTVAGLKYCERHKFRGLGCRRSRKHVEDAGNDNSWAHFTTARPNNSSRDPDKSKSHVSFNVPTSIPTSHVAVVPPSATNVNRSGNESDPTETLESCVRVPLNYDNDSYKTDVEDLYENNFELSRSKNISGNTRDMIDVQNSSSLGFGFSLNSVLQVIGCRSSSLNGKSSIDLEPGRCRRTDGKRWRCKRAVVPYQKYCQMHAHRGTKQHMNYSRHIAASKSATLHLPLTECELLNTNLSISIGASSQVEDNEEKAKASSGSETTITDSPNSHVSS